MPELPKEWGGPCLNGGRNICKGSTMKYFCESRGGYEEIKYFDDGANDPCPALSLSEKDKLFARQDHKLEKLISTGEHDIKAKIFTWKDDSDIMKSL